MPRLILLFTLLLCSFNAHARDTLRLKELVLPGVTNAKHDTVTISVYGCRVKTDQYTLSAKTTVQTQCSYGDPSKNKYKTVKNKYRVSIAFDSTGVLYDSLLKEVERYLVEQEAWSASCPNPSPDFTNLMYTESFYVNDSVISISISTEHEREGAYRIYYVDRCMYMIELTESHGWGSLSSFTRNLFFERNGKKLPLGYYVKNTVRVREILEKEKQRVHR